MDKILKELFIDDSEIYDNQQEYINNNSSANPPIDEAKIKELYNIYMGLYDRARSAIKEHNPCDIHMKMMNGKVRPTCNASRNPVGSGKDLCCGGCKNLGEKGCTVKALTCSTWFCPSVKYIPGLGAEIKDILATMDKYRFWVYRGSEVDSIVKSYLALNHIDERHINDIATFRSQIDKLIQSFSMQTEIKLHLKKLING